jgi:hypothetical protein
MRYMNQIFSSSLNLGAGGNSPSPFRKVYGGVLEKGRSRLTPSTELTSHMSGKLLNFNGFSSPFA